MKLSMCIPRNLALTSPPFAMKAVVKRKEARSFSGSSLFEKSTCDLQDATTQSAPPNQNHYLCQTRRRPRILWLRFPW
jgi:hypothetical protein